MKTLKQISKNTALFSFRSWMALVAGVVFVLLGIFVWLYFPRHLHNEMLDAAHSQARTLATLTAANSASALYFNDVDALNENIMSLSSNINLRYIVVTDYLSRVVASRNLDDALKLQYLATSIDGELSSDGRTQMHKSSVMLNNQSLGFLYIGISLDDMLAVIDESKESTMIICALISLVGIGLIYGFCYSATQSLNKMATAFQQVESGNFSLRVEESPISEINQCISSFNRLLDAVQQMQENFKTSNATLEHRVAERTKELQTEILQRKEIEFALLENERRYRTLIDNSSDGIIIYADEKIIFANAALVSLLHAKSVNDIIGRSMFDFVFQEKKEELRERFVRVLFGSDAQFQDKYTLRKIDGSLMYAQVTAIRLHFHGKPSLQVIIRDLSVKAQGESAKESSEKLPMKAQSVDDFGVLASGIAHDFANILSIIVTGVNKLLFLGEVNKEAVANVAEHIIKAANRGNALVKQLSTFAKRSEIKLENVQVNSIILEIGKTLQQTFPQSISFDFRLSANVNPVKADSAQLHQIIVHLCRTARSVMPFGGKLIISTENVSSGLLLQKGISFHGTEAVCIRVHASGNIIKEELQRKIFEPVFHTKEKTSVQGAGLELAYTIMRNHNGYLDVDVKEEEGTIYSLYFPVSEEQTVLKN